MSRRISWTEGSGGRSERRFGGRGPLAAGAAALAAGLCMSSIAAAGVPAATKTEAAAMSTVAVKRASEGRYGVAAELFHEAFALDPETLGYLYSAARAEQKAGQLEKAERDYRAFLAKASSTDTMVPKARAHLETVMVAREAARQREAAMKVSPAPKPPPSEKPAPAAKAKPAPAPRPPVPPLDPLVRSPERPRPPAPLAPAVVTRSDRSGSWRSAAGWVGLGLGVATVAAGGYLLAGASSEAARLDRRLDDKTISASEATTTLDEAVGRQNLGYALIGAGVAAGAMGAWWLATAPEPTRATAYVDPVRRLAGLTLRF